MAKSYVGYILVFDPLGADYEGSPREISHRCYWNGTGAEGATSIARLFQGDPKLPGSIENLFYEILKSDSGKYSRLFWKYDKNLKENLSSGKYEILS